MWHEQSTSYSDADKSTTVSPNTTNDLSFTGTDSHHHHHS
jgi:hypothetical protein